MKQYRIITASMMLLAAATQNLAAKEVIQTNANTMTYDDNQSWLNGRFGLGTQVGVQGMGFHLRYDVSEKFNLRLEGNYFQFDDNRELEGINYDGEVDFSNIGLLANWHPFTDSGFRLTGGAFAGAFQFDATAGGAGIDVGGLYTTVTGDRLNGNVETNDVTPYLGLGWDFFFGAEKSWVLGIDVGILYVGEPEVSLVGSGELANETAAINAELDQIRSDVEDMTFLPVVKIGFSYRF